MNRIAYSLFLLATLILSSCGASSGYFKIEGKFLHINQGEFYAYSPDGGFDGVDTIHVEGGRFTFEKECKEPYTIMIVFPNFSEQPIFAESGKSVSIDADASHLKQMKVKGTKTNELMNSFRESIQGVAPPEEQRLAAQFIGNHPESPVSTYLVKRYFIATASPDYTKAASLLKTMRKAQPENGTLARLATQTERLKNSAKGTALPHFTAYDTNGKLVPWTELKSAPVAVIISWASYNYDSQDVQREMKRRLKTAKGKLKLLSICLDASKKTCESTLKRDSISWPCICTGDMIEDKTLQLLGMTTLPDNIVLQNGRIVARSLKRQELYNKLDQLVKN